MLFFRDKKHLESKTLFWVKHNCISLAASEEQKSKENLNNIVFRVLQASKQVCKSKSENKCFKQLFDNRRNYIPCRGTISVGVFYNIYYAQ